MKDFTIEKYEQLVKAIKQNNISVYGIKKWFQSNPKYGILLRHDVDRKPANSLKIAEIENKYDVQSTFYFRITTGSFNEAIIKRIYKLGHEIGYHYEDLSAAKGNYDRAIELFENHLKRLKGLVRIETIAMHGSPFSSHDNRDLWQRHNYRDFGVLAEAYLGIDYSDTYYITDTGRTWGQTKANIRDNVRTDLSADIHSTDDLISFINKNKDRKIALVMHPERWSCSQLEWLSNFIIDKVNNTGKVIYHFIVKK